MSKPARSNLWLRPLIFFVLAGALLLAWAFLPVRGILGRLLAWMQGLGGMGLLVLGGLYVVACVLLVPGSVLTIGAGFLAAALWPNHPLLALAAAVATVSVASVTGASAAFLLGRTLARDWVAQKVRDNAKFRVIDDAVCQGGFRMVFLLRLSPVFPFNLLNYSLGLTKVPFRSYVLASWIGMLPGTILYVYLGSAAQNLAALAAGKTRGSTAQNLLLLMGLVATVLVVAWVTRTARKFVNEAIHDQHPETNMEEGS